ncbi:MAG: DUF3373 family protein [Myxococcota bacterium]|nr:DUF3373 family protein [Myxococcota bacterium]
MIHSTLHLAVLVGFVAMLQLGLLTFNAAAQERPAPGPEPTDEERNPDEDIEDLHAENEVLKERVADLEDSVQMLEDDVEQILGSQDQLKAFVTTNRINWRGEYRVTVNMPYLRDTTNDFYLRYVELAVDANGQPILDETGMPLMSEVQEARPRDISDWQDPAWIHRLRLTMQFDIADNLRFYGRLAVYKYFNETHQLSLNADLYSNAYPLAAIMGLERVYFDWFITKWLAITVGRVSSPDGPPAELKENTGRKAGWGLQMIGAEIEAAMVTLHLDALSQGTLLKLYYAPFGMHRPLAINEPTSLIANTYNRLSQSFGGLIETKIPKAGDNLIQIGFISVPKFGTQDLFISVRGLDDPIPPSKPKGDDLGSYNNINGLVMFKDIGGYGLDLFGSYAVTMLKPTNDRMVYKIPFENLPVIHPLTGEVVDVLSGEIDYEIGLASFEKGAGKRRYGHMVFGGFRFSMPWKTYWTRLGGEFNYGTKYHISWSAPSDLLTAKLATKGWAAEGYFIQQLVEKHLFLRVGYLHVKRNFNGVFVGPTDRVDQEIQNIYALVNVAW